MLKKSGGLNRINDFAIQRGIDVDAKQLHLRKTEIFDSMMAEEKISLRPGVANLINHALNNDIALAFVTSTSKANINAIFFALNDQINRNNFSFIGNDRMISFPKPNSEIYLKALSELKLKAKDCIAIEDTQVSMQAALDADISCIGFPGALAQDDDFINAIIVTDDVSPTNISN